MDYGIFDSAFWKVKGPFNYKDDWNSLTNTPTLVSGVGDKGDVYHVGVAGNTNLDGITDWQVGDFAAFNGTVWQKWDNTDLVTSVNTRTGAITGLEEASRKVTAWSTPTTDEKYPSEKLAKDSLDAQQEEIDSLQNDREITREPTGFGEPENVVVTENEDRTVTLTGTVNAYYRGVLNTSIVTGWTSPAHGVDTTTTYFLIYDGTDISWIDLNTADIDWSDLLIAYAFYDGSRWVYLRECHGLQPWNSHKNAHDNIGTYRDSGGAITGTLDSTTVADRRPAISAAVIYDEDVPTTIATVTNEYTQAYNAGTAIGFSRDNNDILPLATNNPYYNSFSSGVWGQTLMPDNSAATVWVFLMPAAQGVTNQKYRLFFLQPQWVTVASNSSAGAMSTARELEEERTASELTLTILDDLSPELVAIGRITVQYRSGNWTLQNILNLTGSKVQQFQSAVPPAVSGFHDINIPAAAWDFPPANSADFDRDSGTHGGIRRIRFDDTAVEYVEAVVRVPTNLDLTGTVTFSAIGYAVTAGTDADVVLSMGHSISGEGDSWDAAYTEVTSGAKRCDNSQDELDYFDWTETVSTLGWVGGDQMRLQFSRTATSGDDNLTGDYGVTHVQIRVPVIG